MLSHGRGIGKDLSGIDDLLGFDGETLRFLDLGLDVCDLNVTGKVSAQAPWDAAVIDRPFPSHPLQHGTSADEGECEQEHLTTRKPETLTHLVLHCFNRKLDHLD